MSVRIAKESDLEQILAIYGPYVADTAISFEYSVPTMEEFTQRFLEITRQFPWLVWEEEGRILGYAYGSAPFERAAFGWCAEPSIYLAPEARGRGIGRALYSALEECLKGQGYRVLYAIITDDNEPSLAFHKALGYQYLAHFPRCGYKMDKWYGITWLEKRLDSVEMPMESPTLFPEFVKIDQNLCNFSAKIPLCEKEKI